MRVHVLTAPTTKGYNCAYPLRAFRHGLERAGITVRVYHRPGRSITNCDVLCITSEHWKWRRRSISDEAIFDEIRRYRDVVGTLVWFDLTDSSGTTRFDLLPYVDLYAKNQLLRDRLQYTRPFYGMRPHTDFYHRLSGIADTSERSRNPASPRQLHKLAIGWNLGLGSYVCRDQLIVGRLRSLRVYWPFVSYTCEGACAMERARPVDVGFRGRLQYDRETVAFQRQEVYRRLTALAKEAGYSTPPPGKLPYKQYRQEMRLTKVVLSPFGFGEINAGRDFECFADGAALVKPNMDHLVTWPNYFEKGVTYAPFAWDFSDFESTITALLTDHDRRVEIASAGQARYLRSLSAEGEKAFVDHFRALMLRAVNQASLDESSVEVH